MIFVAGSTNVDIIVRTASFPRRGGTNIATTDTIRIGGKGFNVAYILSRLGDNHLFMSAIGDDIYGGFLEEKMANSVVNTIIIKKERVESGSAIVILDRSGERSILYSAGANNKILWSDIEQYISEFERANIIASTTEINVGTIASLFRYAKSNGKSTLINLSPPREGAIDLIEYSDFVVATPQVLLELVGIEASHIEGALVCAKKLIKSPHTNILVIMKGRGVLLVTQDYHKFFRWHYHLKNSLYLNSAFIAGFLHYLDMGREIESAIEYAINVAYIVSKKDTRNIDKNDIDNYKLQKAFTKDTDIKRLEDIAKDVRYYIIYQLFHSRSGHPGGSLSAVEILTVLYFHVMRYDPKNPLWAERDRFVLSKGHAAPALYSVLALAGFFKIDELTTLREPGSMLQGHPDAHKTPGVDISTGSLGQGFSAACGMAAGVKLRGIDSRVYVVIGDGEMQEGQIWEAVMFAKHNRLDNLCAIIDYNGLQIDGKINQIMSTIEPIGEKWRAFGWNVITVDGHSIEQLIEAFDMAKLCKGKPTVIIAHTIKGKGVSFMEGIVEYHGAALSTEEVERALEEIEGKE